MNFIKSGAYMGFASAGGSLAILAAYAAVARLVPKEVFGEYQVAGTLMAIAALAAYPKMSGALITAAARKAYGTFPAAVSAVTGKSQYGIPCLLAFAAYYAATGRYGLASAIAATAPFFITNAISGFYEAYCIGTGTVRAYALRSVAATASAAAALVLAALAFPAYSAALVFAFFGVSAATTGRWAYAASTGPLTEHTPVSEESLAFGKKTSWTETLLWAANYADIVLLNAFLGPREVAVYGIARMAPEGIKGLVKNLGVLAAARMAVMEKKAVGSMLAVRLTQATFAAFAVAVLYALFAPVFFRFVFPTYPEAVAYSQLLALSFLAFPAHLAESALTGLLQKKGTVILASTSALSMLVFSLALIPPLGILGAVLARVLARFVNAGTALWLAARFI